MVKLHQEENEVVSQRDSQATMARNVFHLQETQKGDAGKLTRLQSREKNPANRSYSQSSHAYSDIKCSSIRFQEEK